jgi:hypothetical protein
MSESDGDADGDRILNFVGIALVVFLVLAVGAVVLAGSFGASGGSDTDPPEANWSVERINGTHVELIHEGGPPVQINDLIVVVGKTDRGIRRERMIYDGEGFAVPVQQGSSLGLYWKPEEEPIRRVLLKQWSQT